MATVGWGIVGEIGEHLDGGTGKREGDEDGRWVEMLHKIGEHNVAEHYFLRV